MEGKTQKQKKIYTDIWKDLNSVMVDELIKNTLVELPDFGVLKIQRFKRKIKIKENGQPNLPINWILTKKGHADGTLRKDKFIYYTRSWGFKFVWTKCRTSGIGAYKFKPARTNGTKCNNGLVNKLWHFLSQEDTNYLKFPLK